MNELAQPLREVRALYDDESITVYQAYSPAIANPAVAANRFVSPFKIDRMTWIKPSFFWMMYRCGWATKPGQERVLAIRMKRSGFEQALSVASLSHFDADIHPSDESWLAQKEASPVRVQWDPERDAELNPLPWRSIQIGLGGPTVREYVDDWVLDITDITDAVHGRSVRPRDEWMPAERPYPLPPHIGSRLGVAPQAL